MITVLSIAVAFAANAAARSLSDAEIAAAYPNPPALPPASELTYRTLGVNASQTLREAAKAAGIYVGAATNYHYITSGDQKDQYRKVLTTEYDLETAENSCKFGPTEGVRGNFTFEDCDYLFNECTSTSTGNDGGAFRLHNLVWGVYNPDWLTKGGFSASELEGILDNHVSTTLGRYSARAQDGNIVAVDVVNEAIADGGKFGPGQPIFKNADPWYPAVPDYVELAFKAAAKVAGSVPLFYNDYSAEAMNAKSDRVYDMLKGFKSQGIQVDGVGLQCHFTTSYYPNFTQIHDNIVRLGALGLEVHITELDVSVKEQTQAEFEKQAMIYGQLLDAALSAGTSVFRSFETWGFTSLVSWRGVNASALPFDDKFQKKPAYYEMLAVLQKHAK